MSEKIEITKDFIENELRSLSGGSVKFYLYLKATGGMYEMEEVTKHFDVSRRTVTNWLAELTEAGLIGEKKEIVMSEIDK